MSSFAVAVIDAGAAFALIDSNVIMGARASKPILPVRRWIGILVFDMFMYLLHIE
jgi:hypothetical protein